MIGYRKRPFFRAHSLLSAVRKDLGNLIALKDLQFLLLQEIVRSEESVRTLKAELKLLKKSNGPPNDKRLRFLSNRIEGHRQSTYIWRCFGDAIAFLYMDKFALKQTYFNTQNQNAKQNSGFISGKDGLPYEVQLLLSELEHNIPALLTDLTNTIRHGDICLMGASDPHLIEVKKSRELNRRGKRQRHSITQLHRFFDTDRAEGLRGIPELQRFTMAIPEWSYIDQLNECIETAVSKGHSHYQPEKGLHYFAMSRVDLPLDEVLAPIDLREAVIFSLNVLKSNRNWSPYSPFTLTINNCQSLWDFVRGQIYVVIVLETEILCRIAVEQGYEAKILRDEEFFSLEIRQRNHEGVGIISGQMLSRIGLECTSPTWIVLNSIESLKRCEILPSVKDTMPRV